jgi:hypothetical protein
MKGWSCPAETRDPNPRPEMVKANVPWMSSHARTQRLHTMHLDGSYMKYGLDSSAASFRWFCPW